MIDKSEYQVYKIPQTPKLYRHVRNSKGDYLGKGYVSGNKLHTLGNDYALSKVTRACTSSSFIYVLKED